MSGSNNWDTEEINSQPRFDFYKRAALETAYYRYVHGHLRWSKVQRGNNYYTGWVLCYPDGLPITYTGTSGSIRVSASGTYMTA